VVVAPPDVVPAVDRICPTLASDGICHPFLSAAETRPTQRALRSVVLPNLVTPCTIGTHLRTSVYVSFLPQDQMSHEKLNLVGVESILWNFSTGKQSSGQNLLSLTISLRIQIKSPPSLRRSATLAFSGLGIDHSYPKISSISSSS
jgi:hypothetical protein